MNVRAMPADLGPISLSGYKSLNFDYRTATADEIAQRILHDPAEQQKYKNEFEAQVRELDVDNIHTPSASGLSVYQRWERRMELEEQRQALAKAFDASGHEPGFSMWLQEQRNVLELESMYLAYSYEKLDGSEVVRDLRHDHEYFSQRFIDTTAFGFEWLKGKIESGTVTAETLEWARFMTEKIKYVERNDPIQGAESQAFHSRLQELFNLGTSLEAQAQEQLNPPRWHRG